MAKKQTGCEVCGKRANQSCQDVIYESWSDCTEPVCVNDGPIHRFCDEHARNGRVSELRHMFSRFGRQDRKQ